MQAITLPPEHYALYRRGGIVTIIAALLILILGFFNLPTIPFLAILVLLLIIPNLYGIKVWITVLGTEDIVPH